MPFELKNHFLLSRFLKTILRTTQKSLFPYQDLYFAQRTILQDKQVQSQSHQRLNAQFITTVTGNSNRDKSIKMIQFRTVLSEVKMILL